MSNGSDVAETSWEGDDAEGALVRYRALFDALDDGIARFDVDGRIAGVDDALLELTGRSRESLVGEPASALFADGDLAWIERAIDARLEGDVDARESLSVAIRTADGGTTPCDLRLRPIVEDGTFRETVCLVRGASDPTEAAGARGDRDRGIERDDRLAASGHPYRTIAESFPNGIVTLFDSDLEYTLAAGQAFDDIPVDPDDLEGQTVREAWDEGTADTLESAFRDALEGAERTIELAYAGREWVVRVVPIADDAGDVFAGMTMAQDVTERTAAERRLRERERELERHKAYTDDVLDAIDDIFYVVDENATFQRWNESLREVTGYSDAEIETMSPLEFVAPEDREAIAAGIAEVFETGAARVEATVVTKAGDRIPYEFAASSLFDPDGNRVLVGVGRDVTEREEKRRELEATVEQLERSNRRLEQFAYAASHDLQEPLRMVSSYLQLLDERYEDALDDDGREFLEYAVDGADRMREMIQGLLEYSRVETQGDPFEPVDLEDVLEDVREHLRLRIEESDAEITAESLPRVRGDANQLRQLFQNLLSNAIVYSGDDPPRVHVGAERSGSRWNVSVRDEGIGIDPADADRIFDVFQRLHDRESYPGTGIGLALCERIVERHGGDIRVDSEPGEGATFSFTLPAADSTEP